MFEIFLNKEIIELKTVNILIPYVKKKNLYRNYVSIQKLLEAD